MNRDPRAERRAAPKPARIPSGDRPIERSGEGPSSVWLLDANLLIALTHAAHVHHAEAHRWFALQPHRRWASCSLTQLAFVRLTSNPKVAGETISPAEAMQALATMTEQAGHEYWPESPEPLHVSTLSSAALVGHRQVTDAYLLGLTAHKGQRLATLDRGLLSFANALDLGAHIELVSAQPVAQESSAGYAAKRRAKR